jgi:DNA-binding LacI/PurR family transcriptional regulator
MSAGKTPSLQDVARAAGVSAMTVSRALRNSPRVSATARTAVEVAVRRVGYRPDPHVARLMARVRDYRGRRPHAVIGVIRDDLAEDALHDPAYQYVSITDIRRRAEQHGYLAQEFSLGSRGVTPARLNGILRARGVEGVIISPQSSRVVATQLDYSAFAAVTFGYGLPSPALHRASTNMTEGIHDAADRLRARGYRRISLAITEWIDARANHTYSGALLHWQRKIPPRERVAPFFFPGNHPADGRRAFSTWMKRSRPDAIISFHAYVPDWLERDLKLRLPDDVGLVVHDWAESMHDFAGINHRRPYVAAAAVDLLATQLLHNERGIPAVPRQILVPPAWVDGPSIRPLR